jgi:hypothetical protein
MRADSGGSAQVVHIKASMATSEGILILKLDLGGIWASTGRSSPQMCVGQLERRGERYKQRCIPPRQCALRCYVCFPRSRWIFERPTPFGTSTTMSPIPRALKPDLFPALIERGEFRQNLTFHRESTDFSDSEEEGSESALGGNTGSNDSPRDSENWSNSSETNES